MASVRCNDLNTVARKIELSLSKNTSAALIVSVDGIAVSVRNRTDKTDKALSLTGILCNILNIKINKIVALIFNTAQNIT